VRLLVHVVGRACVMSSSEVLDVADCAVDGGAAVRRLDDEPVAALGDLS
jgi:hypothetical protein